MNGEKLKKYFNLTGMAMLVSFFVLSAAMVVRNHGGMEVMLSSDTKVIVFAHWQLEDGFREGFDEAIAEYEKRKAGQGIKVKVRQVAIPVRGYSQWYLTQLIGGEPADVIEIMGSSDIQNQYLISLAPYIGLKNPWNAGTPLEDYSWRDGFVDNMLSAFDPAYSDFFGVCIFMHTTRVYVNVDLYEKACGTSRLPETVTEWLDSCRKIREYGREINKPLIPIGVRGFDKGTLGQLLGNYNSQLNAGLADCGSLYKYGVANSEIFRRVNAGELSKETLLRPYELIHEIGQYFAEGFSAIDLEQTKYLFSSGNVCYFIDGTYNAWSLVSNSPFRVAVIRMPVLDREHPLGRDAVGRVSELGAGVGGKFGIARKSKHRDIALDFLRFITSYDINKMTMVDHCRWMSSLKHVEYEGLMKSFVPVGSTGYIPVGIPFDLGAYSRRRNLQRAERGIIVNDPAPGLSFWNGFLRDRPAIIDELRETGYGIQRNLWVMDATRSALSYGAAETPGGELLKLRGNINLEGVIERWRTLDEQDETIRELEKLKGPDRHGN